MSYAVYVVSGGTGSTGVLAVRTALAQFEDVDVALNVVSQVRTVAQINDAVEHASASGGLIVHTLVDPTMRGIMNDACHANHLIAIDLFGQLMHQMTQHFGRVPLGQPGRYRRMREEDLRRIDAIEFAVEHDDGKRSHELGQAEIVLVGLSRVGKTPLTMYLATQGWKVANVALAEAMRPPDELFSIDKRRVIGLRVEPGQLVQYRRERSKRLNLRVDSDYSSPVELLDEVDFADRVFKQGGFRVVDMTDKPIEEGAEEVLGVVRRNLA